MTKTIPTAINQHSPKSDVFERVLVAPYFDIRPVPVFWLGNTPPTDLLQHIPHDAPRADVLSLGCGDLRDLMYSVLLHGRGQKKLSFVLNDWEPAIHARNLIFLQMVLDSRSLLQECGYADDVDTLVHEMHRVSFQGNDSTNGSENFKKASAAKTSAASAFATRIGVIFR